MPNSWATSPAVAWQPDADYVVGNVCTYDGKVYIAVAVSKNQQPPNATYWTLIGPGARAKYAP